MITIILKVHHLVRDKWKNIGETLKCHITFLYITFACKTMNLRWMTVNIYLWPVKTQCGMWPMYTTLWHMTRAHKHLFVRMRTKVKHTSTKYYKYRLKFPKTMTCNLCAQVCDLCTQIYNLWPVHKSLWPLTCVHKHVTFVAQLHDLWPMQRHLWLVTRVHRYVTCNLHTKSVSCNMCTQICDLWQKTMWLVTCVEKLAICD